MIQKGISLKISLVMFLVSVGVFFIRPAANSTSDFKPEQKNQNVWWKRGIIYEIYVRSFQDSDGDGIGDLKGIAQRLDYFQWLGVDIIWLTPFYPSPMKDFGYDVSDYREVDPRFGTLQDFEELVRKAHEKGLKLMIDLVPNHTSDQHPWFKESKSSKDNPKRNWYYWKDAKVDGSAPNNWLSVLGGAAWEWDKSTEQYYYHAFLKEQPDLNLRNPEVQEAILDIMRFWLDKGVDGFRIDVMWHLMKDESWRDNPVNPNYVDTMPDSDKLLQYYSCDQSEVHDLVKKMRKVLDGYKDRVMLGEIYLPLERVVTYYGNDDEAHLPANFHLMFTDWKSSEMKVLIDRYESLLPDDAWPNWVIGNHDRPRLIDRIGDGQARVAALLLLMLRGTPVMYYGDEIGMEQVKIPESEIQDPQGLLMPGRNLSRDPQRTPMQWEDKKNAGFTSGKPWLRVAKDYKKKNVSAQQQQQNSLLGFYKRLIELRKSEPSLNSGKYYPWYSDSLLLSFVRKQDNAPSFLIVANFSGKKTVFNPKNYPFSGTVVISTPSKREGTKVQGKMTIEPHEGLVIKLDEKK